MTDHDMTSKEAPPAEINERPSVETQELPVESTTTEQDDAQEQEVQELNEDEQRSLLLEKLAKEHTKLKETYLRTAADFDNFRKRTRRDLQAAEIKGKEEALQELLPVVDNLERAVQAASDTSDAKSLIEGVQMVLRLFEDGARRLGIERIGTVGKAFDPTVHEALQQQESDEAAPGTILSEIQPGYLIGSRVLRAALVVVAKPKQKSVEANGGYSDDAETQPPKAVTSEDDAVQANED
ncbi:MAG: nucleotide exchange factor GrpE [Myxococcales bacterium]|nr:MAG: nucleotide exchange factor GrpE [Myxococcales bacterium]